MNWIKLRSGSYANLDQVVRVGAPGPDGCQIDGVGQVLGFADPDVVLPRVDLQVKQAKQREVAATYVPPWQRSAAEGGAA